MELYYSSVSSLQVSWSFQADLLRPFPYNKPHRDERVLLNSKAGLLKQKKTQSQPTKKPNPQEYLALISTGRIGTVYEPASHCVLTGHTLTFRLGLKSVFWVKATPHNSLSRSILPITSQIWLSHPIQVSSWSADFLPVTLHALKASLPQGRAQLLPKRWRIPLQSLICHCLLRELLQTRNKQKHQSSLSASRLSESEWNLLYKVPSQRLGKSLHLFRDGDRTVIHRLKQHDWVRQITIFEKSLLKSFLQSFKNFLHLQWLWIPDDCPFLQGVISLGGFQWHSWSHWTSAKRPSVEREKKYGKDANPITWEKRCLSHKASRVQVVCPIPYTYTQKNQENFHR